MNTEAFRYFYCRHFWDYTNPIFYPGIQVREVFELSRYRHELGIFVYIYIYMTIYVYMFIYIYIYTRVLDMQCVIGILMG